MRRVAATLAMASLVAACASEQSLFGAGSGGGGTASSTSAGGAGGGSTVSTAGSGGVGGVGGGAAGAGGVAGAGGTGGGGMLWNKGFGDTAEDRVWSARRHGSDILTAGISRFSVDFGGGPLPDLGLLNGFVARFDAAGNHLSSVSFHAAHPAVGNVEPVAAAGDPTGSWVLTGFYNGSASFGGPPLPEPSGGISPSNIFLARFDHTGGHLWSKSLVTVQCWWDGPCDATLNSTPSGDTIVALIAPAPVDFGSGPLVVEGPSDIFVARLDPNGQPLWARRYGGAGAELARLAQDETGRIVLGGSFEQTMVLGSNLPLTSAGGRDAFVMELDPLDGDVLWAKAFGDADDQGGGGVATAPNGDVGLVGAFHGTINLGGATFAAGSGAAFAARFDSTGNHLWSKAGAPSSHETFGAACFDSSNRLVAVGYTAYGTYIRLLAWEPNGAVVVDQSFNGAAYPTSVSHLQGDRVILSGYFSDSIDFGLGPLTSVDGHDIFLGVYQL